MAAKAAAPSSAGKIKLIAQNRKARHNFQILDTLEAGMVLQGTEVKSLRAGRCNLGDAYAMLQGGEMWLCSLHISPYEQGNRHNHEPMRRRKLLLHKRELRKLVGKIEEKGLTLVPLKLYFKNGRAKCEIAIARGKKLHDKRAATADRDAKRKVQQAMRGGMKRRGADQ